MLGGLGIALGWPPSNFSDNTALSPMVMLSRSSEAVNVAARKPIPPEMVKNARITTRSFPWRPQCRTNLPYSKFLNIYSSLSFACRMARAQVLSPRGHSLLIACVYSPLYGQITNKIVRAKSCWHNLAPGVNFPYVPD